MITLDAQKAFYPENARHTVPLSAVSTVAFIYSSSHPVALHLVNPDGEIVPCGVLPAATLDWHRLELRNYTGMIFEAVVQDDSEDVPSILLQLDVRHKVGEPVSDIPLTSAVKSVSQISERERTRRTVMQTLMAMQVMPDDDQLSRLEADLGFDFEEDEFGDYLEEGDPIDYDFDPDRSPSVPDEEPPSDPPKKPKKSPAPPEPEDNPEDDPQ